MFQLFYTILLSTLLATSSPFLILSAILRKKHRKSIPARFFFWRNLRVDLENKIWFHGASLGEVNALKPFIKEISKKHKILLTTTTDTGFNSGKNSFETRFLPFEPLLYFWRGNPKTLVVVEAELWFLLFAIFKKRGAKTVLLSGRISENSFPKYYKFRSLYKRVLSKIDFIYAQTEADKNRFQKLGAKNVDVLGNIKLLKSESSRNLEIPKDRRILVGASTHSRDEELILSSYNKRDRLFIVPRHRERFENVWKMIQVFAEKENLSCSRFSENSDFESDIILIDEVGFLVDIYKKSDIVVLGGAFRDGIGGHNPVEPASFQNIIISGKFAFNQKRLFKDISNIYISEKGNLGEFLNSDSLKIAKIEQKIEFKKILNLVRI
ncbi:3-deoxy-D-manno-octulosonic-acid transferase [Thiovulum sp. ES]|nr:3-deoxy-D-manno-octulosonic-acid transferase [Thiovulum sp. ES]